MNKISLSYSKIRKILAYAIGAFMLYFVSKIWINDYKHLTIYRLLTPIIAFLVAMYMDQYFSSTTPKSTSNQMLRNIMVIGGIIMALTFLISKPDGLMIAKLLVNLLHGLIIYSFYKTYNSSENNPAALRFILIMICMMILHIQIFPENWKSCGTFRRSLCYEQVL
jgi:hypothetical protein